jgi:hypothetical protein
VKKPPTYLLYLTAEAYGLGEPCCKLRGWKSRGGSLHAQMLDGGEVLLAPHAWFAVEMETPGRPSDVSLTHD